MQIQPCSTTLKSLLDGVFFDFSGDLLERFFEDLSGDLLERDPSSLSDERCFLLSLKCWLNLQQQYKTDVKTMFATWMRVIHQNCMIRILLINVVQVE